MVRGLVILLTLAITPIALAEMPPLPRGKGDTCVEPTDIMRRQHMDFLFHQRDRTVYEGIRTPRHSLNECVDCHVQRNDESQFIPIDAPGQFCEVCHTFASVKLDCFGCHATRPDDAVASGAMSLKPMNGATLSARSFVSIHANRD